jgi:hypothetical protein
VKELMKDVRAADGGDNRSQIVVTSGDRSWGEDDFAPAAIPGAQGETLLAA